MTSLRMTGEEVGRVNACVARLAHDLSRALERRGYRRVTAYVLRRYDLGPGVYVGVVRRGVARRLHSYARAESPERALRDAFREGGLPC